MVECAGKYDEWIVDDLAGELDEERRSELDGHLAECAECRALRRESLRVIELYRQLPDDEPGAAVEEFVRGQAFADVDAQVAAARIEPGSRASRGKWFAVAASVIFAIGVGVGYGAFYLQSQTEHEQLQADQAVETERVIQEVEAAYEAAAAEAAKASRLAEEAEVEAKRLEGSLEEKEALARAKKLAEDAEKAKAAAKGAAGKANKAGSGGGKAAGKAGGKKKKGIAEDPLGADFEL